ncbi:hypothetical protein ST47_g2889 [Ascochyta rabiei]|uniref:Uncharacterized protein n=1 Tax=Didymella rabiei TaxID=5454 RepID=A0A163IPX7_DIDRA|nr:hypothetical protein ST47_g2889 [Ascochyta rabiei]
MHSLWQISELLVHIVSFLSADDIQGAFRISHHFRTTLKANLPPQLRPLPDGRRRYQSTSRVSPQEVRNKAKAYVSQETATPKQLKIEDTYYYWRESARSQVLDILSPCLHPILSRHVTRLIDGYESLAEGGMSICLQTDNSYHSLYELVHGKHRRDRNGLLAVVPPKSVTVYCLAGASWDLLYSNVRYRSYGGVDRFSVTVEREDGVRLGDILDELRGALIVDGRSGGLGEDILLVWVLDSSSLFSVYHSAGTRNMKDACLWRLEMIFISRKKPRYGGGPCGE